MGVERWPPVLKWASSRALKVESSDLRTFVISYRKVSCKRIAPFLVLSKASGSLASTGQLGYLCWGEWPIRRGGDRHRFRPRYLGHAGWHRCGPAAYLGPLFQSISQGRQRRSMIAACLCALTCVCLRLSVFTCVYVRMCICVSMCLALSLCVSMCVYLCACCVSLSVCSCVCACLFVCLSLSARVSRCMSVHLCVCMRLYICLELWKCNVYW